MTVVFTSLLAAALIIAVVFLVWVSVISLGYAMFCSVDFYQPVKWRVRMAAMYSGISCVSIATLLLIIKLSGV